MPSEVTPRFVQPLNESIAAVPQLASVFSIVLGGPQLGARLVWEWGPVQCKQYDLEDLFVALVICIQHGRGELLQLEQFNILLNDMWESYAFKSYFVYFLHHVMQCVLLTFLVPWWSNVDALSTLRWLLLVLVPSSGLGFA